MEDRGSFDTEARSRARTRSTKSCVGTSATCAWPLQSRPPGRARLRQGQQTRALGFPFRLLEVEVSANRGSPTSGTRALRPTACSLEGRGPRLRCQPSVDKAMIHELATLRFLDNATNVLFAGPPWVRRCWRSPSVGRRSRRDTARTTRRRLIWCSRCRRTALEGRLGHDYAPLCRAAPVDLWESVCGERSSTTP